MCRRVHFPIYELGPVVQAAAAKIWHETGSRLWPIPLFYPFYRPPIKIEQCFIAIKQWRWWQTAGRDFADGCEETVATDRSLASAS